MNIELIRKYCLKKKAVSESFPFGETTPVYKVAGKIFLIANITTPASINLSVILKVAVIREEFDSVTPGYHMNKLHWNTILLQNSIPDTIILNWIDDSYNLVIEGLSKKDKKILLDK